MLKNTFNVLVIIFKNTRSDFDYFVRNEKQSNFLVLGKRALLLKELKSDISLSNYLIFKLMTFNYKENFFNITKNRINLRSGQLKNSYLFFKSDKLNQKTGISL